MYDAALVYYRVGTMEFRRMTVQKVFYVGKFCLIYVLNNHPNVHIYGSYPICMLHDNDLMLTY